ncbi:hypothetical protein PLICRDRAFT_163392 [Plicaturopsis crispa FD-325 SS-3]|nr:hypothetical protein PLICRDRAFT_163392 [Plicaturopsis crispa FD-325 SS-3]
MSGPLPHRPWHWLKNSIGPDSLTWIDRAYAVDWLLATALWFLSFFFTYANVYERPFDINDPLISHPHTKQQMSGSLNGMIALYIPFAACVGVGMMLRSVMDIHHGILSVWASRGLARLITEFIKNRVGRLRPDFLARCKWDGALNACTGKAEDIRDGRRSFPSGHSSTAFAGMTFLSLFIAGKTAAWCFRAPLAPASLRSSRLTRLFITLIPLLYASWVAITRVEDFRHHKEDVIVGSLIGVFAATTCYLVFFPNPFSAQSYSSGPRMLYRDDNNGDSRARNGGFELTRLDDDDMEPV